MPRAHYFTFEENAKVIYLYSCSLLFAQATHYFNFEDRVIFVYLCCKMCVSVFWASQVMPRAHYFAFGEERQGDLSLFVFVGFIVRCVWVFWLGEPRGFQVVPRAVV